MTTVWKKSEAEDGLSVRRLLRLTLLLLAFVAFLSISFPVSSLSQKLEDLYFRLRPAEPPSPDVALVLIDDATLEHYGRWPWPRRRLAQLVRAVNDSHPRAIGVDILLSEVEDESNDLELEKALWASPNLVLAAKISNSADGSLWLEPLPRFARAATAVGHVQAVLDADGLCRRVPLEEATLEGPRLAFSLKLAQLARPELAHLEPTTSASFSRPLERLFPRFLTVNYRPQIQAGDGRPSFTLVSAGDLLRNKTADQLRNKVVVIGFGGIEIGDRLFTPVSNQLPMPGAEINANLTDMLLTGRQINHPSLTVRLFLLVAVSMLSLLIVMHWPGGRGLVSLAGLLIAGYAVAYYLFVHFHHLLPYGPMLVAGIFAAPLAQLENLIVVDRALTRRLHDLREVIVPHKAGFIDGRKLNGVNSQSASRLHWKLQAIRELQAELAGLYLFDQRLIETMQESLVVFGPSGELLFSNAGWRRFCEKHGRAPSNMDEFAAMMNGSMGSRPLPTATGTWVEAELPLGEELWRLRSVRLPSTSAIAQGAVLVVMEDITARRERDQARSEALSFVTHELRTPLIAIQGFAELLMRYPTSGTSVEAPGTIFRESRRLVAMINTYLEVLRLDAGVRPLDKKIIEPGTLVKHVEQIVQPLAQAAQVNVRTEFVGETTGLEADEALLGGAILNLVSNAIKYSPKNSDVLIRVVSREDQIAFEVHNSGQVIPQDEQERLFERFYRSPQHGNATPGWGIGLSFVKRICEQHGGTVGVSSNAESGTCFRFVFPLTIEAHSKVLR